MLVPKRRQKALRVSNLALLMSFSSDIMALKGLMSSDVGLTYQRQPN